MRFGAIPAGCLLLTGCATQPPSIAHMPGLFHGFLHGLTALPALLGSLVLPVRIYAFPNDGLPYDIGFCAGFMVALLVLVVPLIPFVGAFLTRRS